MSKAISQIMFDQANFHIEGPHRRWLLARHPVGTLTAADFQYVEDVVPVPPPGKYLARVIWIGIDPKQRLLMNPTPRNVELAGLFSPPFAYGVGEVLVSKHPNFQAGDIVHDIFGWQSHALMDGTGHYVNNPFGTRKINRTYGPISTALGVLGNGGLTAYFSVLRELKPRAGETMLVSSAAGNVGSIAGQIGKIFGCRVIGLTSTDEKCAAVVKDFGFDDCINYRSATDLAAAIRKAAPNGIDMYYDNVGGPIAEAAAQILNPGGRVTIVGYVGNYNAVKDGKAWSWPAHLAKTQFIYHDYHAEFEGGLEVLSDWIKAGKIRYREDILEGLDRMPEALIGLLEGGNIGKRIVRVGENPAGVD